MSAGRWTRIEELFHRAVDLKPVERALFFDEACAGEEDLRRDVESLLAHDASKDNAVQAAVGRAFEHIPHSPAADGDLVTSVTLTGAGLGSAPWLPATIGRYRILRLVGEGGMGTVYEAEQEHPRRLVALKVIKQGFANPQLLRRFEQESQALGRLQHPGIAQIFEAGTADSGFGPQPYFAMEFIRGEPLIEYAEAHQLKTRQRLDLMAKVCDGVHHAHQRGIIHRDLKPGNILVDESGQPKILDLGVARVTDSDSHATSQTDVGQIVGTLAYMSPEQVLADPLELDTRSDVYALGVILFELLTRRLPYQIRGQLHEAVQTIRQTDPARLSSISRVYRGDIETIVSKALEKDKGRRYASAAGMADDIHRYLNDEPIIARPPSATYQLLKFAHRHKALVAGVGAVFIVLIAGIIASTWEATRARRAEQSAVDERDRAAASQRAATRERDRALTAERVAADDRSRALLAERQVGYERDRAVEAEKTAVDERNRALHAEQTATTERNRAVGEQQRADGESAVARAVNEFLLYDLLAQAGPDAQARPEVRPDPDLKVRTTLDRAAATVGGRFNGRPLIEASIRKTIGNAYKQLGLYPEAQTQLQRALELQNRFLGEEHVETLGTMYDLAHNLFRYQGKHEQARPLLIKVLDARRRTLGEDAPSTLDAMNKLADLYRFEGKLGLAEPLLSSALDRSRRVLGEQSSLTLDTENNLALVYRTQGRYEEAGNLLTGALDGTRRLLGKDHPETLIISDNLASVYMAQGMDARAELLFESVLLARQRVLGEDHQDTWNTMSSLAGLYRRQGKYTQAEPLYSKLMEARRRALGEGDPATLNGMLALASVYAEEQKCAEAETLYNRVLNLRRSALGEENLATLIAAHALATLYFQQGKYLQAEQLCLNVLKIGSRVLGPQHPINAIESGLLGELRLEQRRYAEAEALLREALSFFGRITLSDPWSRYRWESALGVSLAGQGKNSEAESFLLSAYAGMQQQRALSALNRFRMEQAGKRIIQFYRDRGLPDKVAEWQRK